MSALQKINIKNWVLFILILIAVAFRFLPLFNHSVLANFTPVGAIALFGGTYYKSKLKSYLVPLLSLFLSDIVLNFFYSGKWQLFYSGFVWVYLSFAIMVFIGSRIKNVNLKSLLLASILSVVVHWLLTDIQPWLAGNMYNKDFSGYIQSLVAAIPFEKNMLIGNLLFVTVLYGCFEVTGIYLTDKLEKLPS